MTGLDIHTVAVVGTGVIGRSWIRVFVGAGHPTRVFDPDPDQLAYAMNWLSEDLERDVAGGLLSSDDASKQVALAGSVESLEEAISGVDYVQESGPEKLSIKRAIFSDLDRLAGKDAILASSTSAMDMTEIASGLEGARRCIVAHPTNPPHVVPAVEVLGGKNTDSSIIETTVEFLRSVGQTPVVLNFFVEGFLLNRLQSALVREAFNLVQSGVADVDAVDAVVRDGLGLRWALMGPFGVGNTNADGGVREYFTRFRQDYIELMDDLEGTPPITDEFIERLGQQVDDATRGSSVADINRWRDTMVTEIRRLKERHPEPWKK